MTKEQFETLLKKHIVNIDCDHCSCGEYEVLFVEHLSTAFEAAELFGEAAE